MDFRAWTRLGGESNDAFAAFQDWLHSTDSNGFRKDLYEWARDKQDEGITSEVLAWAHHDHWLIRAKEYDVFVGKRSIIKNFPLTAPACVLMVKLATVELERMSKAQDSTEFSGTVDPRLVERYLRLALSAEREARKVDMLVQAKGNKGESSSEVYDFLQLDIEELRLMEPLLDKARVKR